MKIIAHCNDPSDLILVGRSVRRLQELGTDSLILAFGEPEVASVFLKRNKASITAWVTDCTPQSSD